MRNKSAKTTLVIRVLITTTITFDLMDMILKVQTSK